MDKPISVHPQVAAGSTAAVISAVVFANLAWAGIVVPLDVIAADTALIGLAVGLIQRFAPWFG